MADENKTAESTEKKELKQPKPVKPCCFLSNGLAILNAKRQDGDIVVLTATDFIKSAKLFFDRKEKQLVPNPYSIRLSESDGNKLTDWLQK